MVVAGGFMVLGITATSAWLWFLYRMATMFPTAASVVVCCIVGVSAVVAAAEMARPGGPIRHYPNWYN